MSIEYLIRLIKIKRGVVRVKKLGFPVIGASQTFFKLKKFSNKSNP